MLNQKQRAYSEWLVLRSQQGDQQAFAALIKLWQQRYFLYALRRVEQRDAARDVAQDALLSISRNLGKLGDPASFPAWSYRILERRCVDWLRKTIRERRLFSETSELPEVLVEDRLEDKLSIKQLLATLDPAVRSVLQLYYLEGLSVSEIAGILDVPGGTVKSRLYYARKSLAQLAD